MILGGEINKGVPSHFCGQVQAKLHSLKYKGGEISLFWGKGIAKKYRTLMAQKFDAFLFNPIPDLHPAV